MNKKEKLAAAIKAFMDNQSPATMFEMLSATVSVTKQGSGLLWSDVKEVVDNSYNANKPEISSL